MEEPKIVAVEIEKCKDEYGEDVESADYMVHIRFDNAKCIDIITRENYNNGFSQWLDRDHWSKVCSTHNKHREQIGLETIDINF